MEATQLQGLKAKLLTKWLKHRIGTIYVDSYEKLAYTLFGIVAALYVLAMVVGMIVAFPYGLIGFLVLIGIGILFIKVLRERTQNKEDDYYSKKVDK